MKKAKTGKIDWNKNVVGKLTKSAFVKKFEKIFPDVNLEDEYNKLFPPKSNKSQIDKGQEPES